MYYDTEKKEGGIMWGQVGNNRKSQQKYYFNKKSVYNRQIDVGIL